MRIHETTDGLATLRIDHETWELWLDVRYEDATPDTWGEVFRVCDEEGLYIVDTDECPLKAVDDETDRLTLSYKEPRDC
ncbi:hypothetical protein FHR83_007121 [Actinoplanes campanulatus]|uniref:Uncharacterized protein n=1 Tax=Actinoplanes campanulatus TaxID=113559 RepID=A0A7W5FIF3_9ACTN|nr:hypothetical protein [Actinoplanes campanulatus]MBB3099415.1 hypothetical protein [Actinoplanes campanulatus]GGN40094.1 hypothetical protein GCM10010109_68710 [Actinoplanes campanulatus]GID42376.1 hypothetical protein Aca09nite_88820 [Actinoplanes campanulatus]